MEITATKSGILLQQIRQLMKNKQYVYEEIHAYIIPSTDSHQNKFIAKCDRRLQFITGFDGLSGTAIITTDKAALWTDASYYFQASQQLDKHWTLMKQQTCEKTLTQAEWLCKVLSSGNRIGFDPFLLAFNKWKRLDKILTSSGLKLIPIETNLVDVIWREKPPMALKPIYILPVVYAGKIWQCKVSEIRQSMKSKKAFALVLTALDEIAWLFNLRGADIEFNPLFFAYTIVTLKTLYLFVDTSKINDEVREHLFTQNAPEFMVEIKPYAQILDFLKSEIIINNGQIWISKHSSFAIVNCIPESNRILDMNPVSISMLIKNRAEIEGMRRAQIKESIALCEFFAWLEEEVCNGNVTEASVAQKLEEIKMKQAEYMGPSFATISASGPNASCFQYQCFKEISRRLSKKEIYLCSTGSQFKHGTTGITRTLHLGKPTEFQKDCYTRIVKGFINLARSTFPVQTKGVQLDSLARKYLWDVGLDYMHATAHGVGMFLCVHESNASISAGCKDAELQENMILSVEPGFYEDGKFGMRVENLALVKKAQTKHTFQDFQFLSFEIISFVPFCRKLLNAFAMTHEEIEWLDAYNHNCREIIGKELREQSLLKAFQWLLKETEKISITDSVLLAEL
ncbi:aminopeptidase-like protein [Dinothrombium tinctorium]|uniref:Aminopeptidase-like protein n=1 Tax=Dinothrombium tinctorium TaxID=1965070 RepID=A0A3S3NVY8_9ACAR|nr:aminopeptidase-like protein [Dinothrombium tinctorium]